MALIISFFLVIGAFLSVSELLVFKDLLSSRPESRPDLFQKLLTPLVTLMLSSISTLSAILLGWRVDRRQAKELDPKTKDLELKIKELEIKLAASQTPNTQPQRQQFPNF
jgi:hypothetical protein